MVLLTIQTNESFARDFGKHKFDKLFQYCTHELKATSLLVKRMHLQAIMASNSQSVLYQLRIRATETQYKGLQVLL